MNAIVAVDNNWGIGRDGSLLFIIPKDFSRFKGLTKGRTILLGHETLRTFPDGKPLKDRRNVILSRNKDLRVPGAEVMYSLEEALATLDLDTVSIVGGESLYRQTLDMCDEIHVTKVKRTVEDADRFFQNLDEDPEWEITWEDGPRHFGLWTFTFYTYTRKSKLNKA